MRSDLKPLNSVSLFLSQRKNQIACPHCYDAVIGGRSRTVLDDSGALAITAWTCAECGGVIEEVRIMTQGRTSHPRPIRYAEKPRYSIGHPAPVAQHAQEVTEALAGRNGI